MPDESHACGYCGRDFESLADARMHEPICPYAEEIFGKEEGGEEC